MSEVTGWAGGAKIVCQFAKIKDKLEERKGWGDGGEICGMWERFTKQHNNHAPPLPPPVHINVTLSLCPSL